MYWIVTRLVSRLPFLSQRWRESDPQRSFLWLALACFIYLNLWITFHWVSARCPRLLTALNYDVCMFLHKCLLCGTFSTNDTTVSAHQKWTSVKFNREIYNQLLPETYSFDYQLEVCIVCIYVYAYVCMYVYSNTTPLDLGINFFLVDSTGSICFLSTSCILKEKAVNYFILRNYEHATCIYCLPNGNMSVFL